jgi:tetratricopeptide (TPR) repeat protein
MSERHLTIELLRAVHRGDKSSDDLAISAIAHLLDDCDTCRAAFETWRREAREDVACEVSHEYDEAFERVKARLLGLPEAFSPEEGEEASRSLEEQIEKKRAIAASLAEDLLSTPRRERAAWLRSHREQCNGPLLAGALIDRAKDFLPGRPDEAFDAASTARAVLQSGRPDDMASELYARALAYQANARRIKGELREAKEILEIARYLLKIQGGGDRLTRAEMDRIEAALCYAQRRFPDAESMYSRAIMTYALEGEDLEVATTLLSLGVAYREMTEYDRAIEATNQALEILSEEDRPHLQLYARHNMVTFLVETRRTREARELFSQIQDLYAKYSDPLSSLRRTWLEGRLACAENDVQQAETLYEAVRQGFMSRGIGFDAALASLDLATLYAEQGRTAELKRIAEEIVPVFEAQDVHREAAAALMLFQDAVRTEQVTLGYVLELTRYLQRARLDPDLQFRIPA